MSNVRLARIQKTRLFFSDRKGFLQLLEGDLAIGVGLRVGVGLGGCAVRRPAGVTDTDCAVERLVVRELLEMVELAGRPQNADVLGTHDRHPGRVVTPILQPAQTVEEDWYDLIRSDVTDDPAHIRRHQVRIIL